jgi:hypothetical protein
MKKPSRSSKATIAALLIILLASCSVSKRQSEALDDFAKTYNESLRGFYFYPSTVRMLGTIFGAEDGAFLKDIAQGRIFVLWGDDSETDPVNFDALKQGIEREGFEILISMKSSGVMVDAYEREGNLPMYMLFVNDPDNPFIVEMAGTLSIDAIRQVAAMDFEKANALLNLFPENEQAAQEEPTEPTKDE